jgi:hypothetical protein
VLVAAGASFPAAGVRPPRRSLRATAQP